MTQFFQRNDGMRKPNENQSPFHIYTTNAPNLTAFYNVAPNTRMYITGCLIWSGTSGAMLDFNDGTASFCPWHQFAGGGSLCPYTGGIVAVIDGGPLGATLTLTSDSGNSDNNIVIWGWEETYT